VVTLGLSEFTRSINNSINGAIEFNRSMGAIATLIPGSNERVLEIKESIRGLSLEYGKTAQDVTGGTFELLSAFGDSANVIQKQSIAIKAASAAQSDSKEAIGLLSGVTRAYGDESIGAFQKASDLAFVAAKLGQTTFP